MSDSAGSTSLTRDLGLLGLAATGICSMMGAGIHVVPIMIQRNVPGIGNGVLASFAFAAVPAVLAALAYAGLASAMPRAGGSYVYASRSIHPYLGFVASFSQWFGLSIAIGVVSYVLVPFIRDVVHALEWVGLAQALDQGGVRVSLSLAFLWGSVWINLRGSQLYERTLIPLMFVMFLLGSIVIVAGFLFDHADFAAALMAAEGRAVPDPPVGTGFTFTTFLSGAAVLFASFIGFDSIAQAGGEAKNPRRNLPLAIAIAIGTVGSFYFLFTAAVYHAVPWTFIAEEAQTRDLTAPGLLGYLLPTGWTVLIVAGAAIALINDLPAMLLAVSRLVFAWARDGIFPRFLGGVHPERRTPQPALLLSGAMASVGILGSHFAGDFFLGIDILVTSMLVNFLVMCLSLAVLARRQPKLAENVAIPRSLKHQALVGWAGTVLLLCFLVVHVSKDLQAPVDAWYFRSTWV